MIRLMETEELIRSRRTTHHFKPNAVPTALIRKGLELACLAPNHHLTQPWRFYLLGKKTAHAIAKLNSELVAARRGPEAGQDKLDRWAEVPGWLVVTCLSSDDEIRQREDLMACACAIQNLSLFLWDQGVGSKWTTGEVTRHEQFPELVGFDKNSESLVGLLWYGYPEKVAKMPRQPLDKVLRGRP